MPQRVLAILISLFIVGCSSQPRIVVNQATVENQEQYDQDFKLCYDIASTIDLSDEVAIKGVLQVGACGVPRLLKKRGSLASG